MIRMSANLTTVNLTMEHHRSDRAGEDPPKRVQYRPALLVSFHASTRLDFEPLL